MTRAVLTLQIPDLQKNRGVIIAATTDRQMLLTFRRHVLGQHAEAILYCSDDEVRQLRRLDYERVRQALDAVIPEDK